MFSPVCFPLIFSHANKASLSDQSIGSNHPAVTPMYGSSLRDDHKSVVIQTDLAPCNILVSCSVDHSNASLMMRFAFSSPGTLKPEHATFIKALNDWDRRRQSG